MSVKNTTDDANPLPRSSRGQCRELFQKMEIQGMLSLVHARGLEIVKVVIQ